MAIRRRALGIGAQSAMRSRFPDIEWRLQSSVRSQPPFSARPSTNLVDFTSISRSGTGSEATAPAMAMRASPPMISVLKEVENQDRSAMPSVSSQRSTLATIYTRSTAGKRIYELREVEAES